MKLCEAPECHDPALFRIGLKNPWTWPKNLCHVHTIKFIEAERQRSNLAVLTHDFNANTPEAICAAGFENYLRTEAALRAALAETSPDNQEGKS